MKQENLKLRSDLLRAVRSAFYDEDFIEVTTRTKIAAPAPEEFIEAVCAEKEFLRTSPELEMKRMLADGADKIFQIGPCFRSGEHGRKHREEFTMLEYYARDWNYLSLAEFTARAIQKAFRKVRGSAKIRYQGKAVDLNEVEYITVEEAYRKFAGMSTAEAEKKDVFDEVMVTKIEPELGNGHLTFLMDYPANRASLARLCPENHAYAQRWELYCCGIELGNAFGELTDASEQKERFRKSKQFRAAQKMHAYPDPVEFFDALERGLPFSSGSAIGFDRLSMLCADAADIADVIFE